MNDRAHLGLVGLLSVSVCLSTHAVNLKKRTVVMYVLWIPENTECFILRVHAETFRKGLYGVVLDINIAVSFRDSSSYIYCYEGGN